MKQLIILAIVAILVALSLTLIPESSAYVSPLPTGDFVTALRPRTPNPEIVPIRTLTPSKLLTPQVTYKYEFRLGTLRNWEDIMEKITAWLESLSLP